jgi:hypothetical protein
VATIGPLKGGLLSFAGWAAVVSLAALLAFGWCHLTIPRFFNGQRPHARNRVPGEYEA